MTTINQPIVDVLREKGQKLAMAMSIHWRKLIYWLHIKTLLLKPWQEIRERGERLAEALKLITDNYQSMLSMYHNNKSTTNDAIKLARQALKEWEENDV